MYNYTFTVKIRGDMREQCSFVANSQEEAETKLKKRWGNTISYDLSEVSAEAVIPLENVVKGDKVLFYRKGGDPQKVIVEHATKNFIIVRDGIKFRRDGSEVSEWPRCHIAMFEQNAIEAYEERQRNREELEFLKDFDWRKLSKESRKYVIAFIKKED